MKEFDAALVRRLRGLLRLAEHAVEADAAKTDPWQHAVPIDVLRNHTGLTDADLRWLIAEGLASQRIEVTAPRAKKRAFRRTGALNSAARACFVASRAGLRVAQRLCDVADADASPSGLKPEWNPATGDWTFNGALVKHLHENARTQREVLKQCEQQGWAEVIDSPFAQMTPKRRSHYLGQVLNHLNSSQKEAHIHFSAINKGRQFRWIVVDAG